MAILIPSDEIPFSEKKAIIAEAKRLAYEQLRKNGLVSSMDDCVFRMPMLGDSSSTDFHDLTAGTSATSGQQEWSIDSAALTAGDLSNVISTTAGEDSSQVAATKAIAFYGFSDVSGTRDLIGFQFSKGSKAVQYAHFEGVYASPAPSGYMDEMVVYSPKDTVKIKMLARAGISAVSGQDYRWVPLAVLAEPKGSSLAAAL